MIHAPAHLGVAHHPRVISTERTTPSCHLDRAHHPLVSSRPSAPPPRVISTERTTPSCHLDWRPKAETERYPHSTRKPAPHSSRVYPGQRAGTSTTTAKNRRPNLRLEPCTLTTAVGHSERSEAQPRNLALEYIVRHTLKSNPRPDSVIPAQCVIPSERSEPRDLAREYTLIHTLRSDPRPDSVIPGATRNPDLPCVSMSPFNSRLSNPRFLCNPRCHACAVVRICMLLQSF
jgi:hypothetical protein